jgi:hypothetical protein
MALKMIRRCRVPDSPRDDALWTRQWAQPPIGPKSSTRHEAGAVSDKQQRSAIVDAPGELAADWTAQLQLVCDAKRPRQVRRNLPSSIRSTVNATFALSGVDAVAYERSAW